MLKCNPYPNAPITEAIIDLRVQLPKGVGLRDLELGYQGQESAYPNFEQRNVAVGQMSVGKDVTASASSKPVGYFLRSADNCQVCQTRLDGFTMSRLAPYDRWEPFRDEARRLWDSYVAATQPEMVTRIAVRFINRIDIPLPMGDLGDYLRTAPELSKDLPQGLAGFFMRLLIPMEDIRSGCIVNEAIVEPERPGVASVILDIDVFRQEELPTDEDTLWSFFEELRLRKNQVFEASITDKSRELFQ